MIPLQLNRKRHRLVCSPIAKAACTKTGSPDFGVYYHLETGNFVLFRWMNRTQKIVQEYFTFRHPTEVTREQMRKLAFMYSPLQYRALKAAEKDARMARHNENHRIENDCRRSKSRQDWARRKLKIHKQDHPDFMKVLW